VHCTDEHGKKDGDSDPDPDALVDWGRVCKGLEKSQNCGEQCQEAERCEPEAYQELVLLWFSLFDGSLALRRDCLAVRGAERRELGN